MHSKLQAALCLTHPPVAVYKTHQPPEGSLTMPEGSHGCVIALLAAAAKGKTAAFQETTVGCPGGKAGLGFAPLKPGFMSEFLSTGNDARPGMRYKETPALADDYIHSLPHTPPPEWLVFQPLDQVAETVNPLAVVFLVNADQLSGLITLANYDRPTQDNVKVLFGAGCVQSILYSLCQEEAGGDTCYLGLTDPSARLHIPPRTALLFPPLSSFPRVGRQGGGEFPHYRNLEKDLPPDFMQTIIRISPIERRRCFALHTILQHHISVECLPPGAADSCPGDFHEHKGRPWRLPYYLSLLQRFLHLVPQFW